MVGFFVYLPFLPLDFLAAFLASIVLFAAKRFAVFGEPFDLRFDFKPVGLFAIYFILFFMGDILAIFYVHIFFTKLILFLRYYLYIVRYKNKI